MIVTNIVTDIVVLLIMFIFHIILHFQDVNWDEHWDPRIYFFNAVNIDKMQTNHYIMPNDDDDPDGIPDVRLSIRMKGTFKCSMQLKDFPFDCQVRQS